MTLSTDDIGVLCICSVRYALGRTSYIVGTISRLVSSLAPQLSFSDRHVIMQDIVEQAKRGYGHIDDKQDWLKLLEVLTEAESEGKNAD